jgi:hypothetical protein
MANTFITPTMVARDAAIALEDRLTVGNLVSRDKEGLFTASKVGDEIKVTVPPAVSDASEFTGSTSATDQTETEVGLKLEKHFYKRVDLTSKQKSLELSDFTRLVTVPQIQGIQESIDKFILRNMQVFRANLAGTVGNRPSTMAHVAAATKKLNDLKVTRGGRIALVDSTVEQSLIQLSQFTSLDYGPDAATGMREGLLGRRYGFDFHTDVNLGAFSRSAAANDIAGTVLTNGTPAIGATTFNIDGITSTTGTIYAGTVFTMAGDTTRYVVRKDATIAANATTLIGSNNLYANATADFQNDGTGTPIHAPRQFRGTAAPASGTWEAADIVWDTTPASGAAPGWVCTAAGTPGTWKAMANLA